MATAMLGLDFDQLNSHSSQDKACCVTFHGTVSSLPAHGIDVDEHMRMWAIEPT